jgi:hypothetical protein
LGGGRLGTSRFGFALGEAPAGSAVIDNRISFCVQRNQRV